MGANLEIMKAFFTQFSGGDWEGACKTYLTDDFETLEPPELPQGGVFRGWDSPIRISNIYRNIWDIEVLDVKFWDEEGTDVVVSRYLLKWTNKKTGLTITEPGVELNTIRDGKISKMEVFHFDPAGLVATMTPPEK